jgi:pimeloyl-ACP methyl ester carboxylesterase
MGALVALEFALRRPERVRGVAALNGVYCRTPEQRAAVERRAHALEGGSGSPEETIARWFGDPVPPALIHQAESARKHLRSADPVGYARAYRLFAVSDEAHRGRLEGLAVPALFMTGELDPNSTPAMSRAMAAAAPNGRCEVLPGERHMMPMTAPEAVNARLRAFFDSTQSEAPARRFANNREVIS